MGLWKWVSRGQECEDGDAKYKIWDATPENCVRFFRVVDHSGMKYSQLIVYCLPVQSAEHFAVGLHS